MRAERNLPRVIFGAMPGDAQPRRATAAGANDLYRTQTIVTGQGRNQPPESALPLPRAVLIKGFRASCLTGRSQTRIVQGDSPGLRPTTSMSTRRAASPE